MLLHNKYYDVTSLVLAYICSFI